MDGVLQALKGAPVGSLVQYVVGTWVIRAPWEKAGTQIEMPMVRHEVILIYMMLVNGEHSCQEDY